MRRVSVRRAAIPYVRVSDVHPATLRWSALVNGQDEYTAAYGSLFTVRRDQTSGTLNISFTDSPQAPGAVSVRGSWRCA